MYGKTAKYNRHLEAKVKIILYMYYLKTSLCRHASWSNDLFAFWEFRGRIYKAILEFYSREITSSRMYWFLIINILYFLNYGHDPGMNLLVTKRLHDTDSISKGPLIHAKFAILSEWNATERIIKKDNDSFYSCIHLYNDVIQASYCWVNQYQNYGGITLNKIPT